MAALLVLLAGCGKPKQQNLPSPQVAEARPELFPERIWAACDFELLRNDVVWSARHEGENVPPYPANNFAAAARELAPGVSSLSVIFTRYPRAEAGSKVYFRYYLGGEGQLELRLFNQDRQAWHRLTLTGLARGEWAEAAADFGEVGDERGGGPLESGERVSEAAFVLHGDGELLIDDIICFAGGSRADGAREKFPRRVIALWGFDPVESYHPWTHADFRVNHKHESLSRGWGAGEALDREQRGVKRIRLIIDPPQQVGEHSRLRYNCWLENVRRVQPMIFDLTDMDNRHVGLEHQPQGEWFTETVDFTADGIRNDGNQTPFEAGSRVDDIFYLAWPADEAAEFTLLVDDVVLYDAYE